MFRPHHLGKGQPKTSIPPQPPTWLILSIPYRVCMRLIGSVRIISFAKHA